MKKSGFLDKLTPGDEVMTDKVFLIQDELAATQAHLVIPPLLKQKVQFSEGNFIKQDPLQTFESMLKGLWRGLKTTVFLIEHSL